MFVAVHAAKKIVWHRYPYNDPHFAGLINTTTEWVASDGRPAVGQRHRQNLLDGDDRTLADYSSASWDSEGISIGRDTKIRAVVFTRYWDARSSSLPYVSGMPIGFTHTVEELGTRYQRIIYRWSEPMNDRNLAFGSPSGADDSVSIEIWEEPFPVNNYVADGYVNEGYVQ